MAGYPSQYESDIVARDGSTLRLRPMRPDDEAGLRALYGRLSGESLHFRFRGRRTDGEAEVARLLGADSENEFVLVAGGFTGRLYAVHPSAASIDGVPAYPRVTAIPESIDLAVIAVPRDRVSGVVDDCIAKGVRALVAHQPLPAGRRVAVLSNAGGPAILAADACEAHGLDLAPLSDATVAGLRSLLPATATLGNPIDMLASATPGEYEEATRLLLADGQVDSLVVIFTPPLVPQVPAVARAIAAGAAEAAKPVLANFISSRGAPPELAPIPSYLFPESAVAALARATSYGAWRRRPTGAREVGYPVVRPLTRRIAY
ncbi:MAG: hypothetical protein A3I61_03485 [Acidobacteria bacterium RIFCSPLOWO2_02_FULL_68_18]|nr:MAG: hypothetical protein A3I61_03485 [Acidobacteria bacterium RIFCSPLOWO2_02_FULL_68_18]OFW48175.1 MAG: hypothetical protein A3G77_04915 [Acidobacteria bacterium RIFCSPLOWO2_12_FULL_68_19]